MPSIRASLAQVSTATAALSCVVDEFAALTDADLMSLQSDVALVSKRVQSFAAMTAGEIARRSSREHGFGGLAQRTGFRTPASLVQKLTGSTSREAIKLVTAGETIHDALSSPAGLAGDVTGEGATDKDGSASPSAPRSAAWAPWLRAVGEALAAGTITVDAAAAIRSGLGSPDDSVTSEQLADAAGVLVLAARELNADQVGIRARAMRDDLDEEGIVTRERDMRAKEYLRIYRRPDGMVGGSFLYAPENAAILTSALDAVTSPRRGGPRMVDETEKARAAAIVADPRTTDKIAADAFIEMIRIAGEADKQTVFGARRPAVQVLTTATALRDRRGRGHIEGVPTPVSITTVERIACADGIVSVSFDDKGLPLDVGRTQRRFTRRQRIALAARDGGCMAPGCPRPPSWTEAHHIEHWHRDDGPTDIANGTLLCRYHHLLFHDNGWEIERRGDELWLIPPAQVDPERTPIRMPSKSAAYREFRKTA